MMIWREMGEKYFNTYLLYFESVFHGKIVLRKISYQTEGRQLRPSRTFLAPVFNEFSGSCDSLMASPRSSIIRRTWQ